MMMDKNGREIRTGDVVRVSGAYFKNDNGLFFAECVPGDANWSGEYISLRKVCRDGRISVTKYSISSWPLYSYVSDREKTCLANMWNAEHAEIEVVDNIDRRLIREYFFNKAAEMGPQMVWIADNWGKHSHDYLRTMKIRDHYVKVINSIA